MGGRKSLKWESHQVPMNVQGGYELSTSGVNGNSWGRTASHVLMVFAATQLLLCLCPDLISCCTLDFVL